MKDTSKNTLLQEFHQEPRTTQYQVKIYFEPDDGDTELYEAIHANSPPLVPDVGDTMCVDWVEDDEDNEPDSAVPITSDSVGTDEKYTEVTSPELEVVNVNTRYTKRDALTGVEYTPVLIVKKIVTLNSFT